MKLLLKSLKIEVKKLKLITMVKKSEGTYSDYEENKKKQKKLFLGSSNNTEINFLKKLRF